MNIKALAAQVICALLGLVSLIVIDDYSSYLVAMPIMCIVFVFALMAEHIHPIN